MSRATILYVEDDEALSFVTKDHLELNEFEIDHVSKGDMAVAKFKSKAYDLCLLDVMLPGENGFDIAKTIRQLNPSVPILFLTAKSLKEDRLKGFDVGGDDYILKPYSIEELVMKINVFLKRRNIDRADSADQLIPVGIYTFNRQDMTLTLEEVVKQLTQKECDILALFCGKQNQLLSRSEILISVWGEDDYFLGRSLDVFISKLRKYLKKDENISLQNVHGVGFKMNIKQQK